LKEGLKEGLKEERKAGLKDRRMEGRETSFATSTPVVSSTTMGSITTTTSI
jgi:hypothetical protein